jgi:transposase-like protein
MTKGRKTTYDERVEIVKYCVEHEYKYNDAAQKYQVSYQQVYTWMEKYKHDGVEGLEDRRGKRKEEDEMSELEKLKAKNKLLEAENRQKQMEIDFLKKLNEIEGRRY